MLRRSSGGKNQLREPLLRAQILALLELGWSYRRIEAETIVPLTGKSYRLRQWTSTTDD